MMKIFYFMSILIVLLQFANCATNVEDVNRVSDKSVEYMPRTFIFVEEVPVDNMHSVMEDVKQSYQSRVAFLENLKKNRDINRNSIKEYEGWARDLVELIRKIDEGHFTDPFKARSDFESINNKYMPSDYQ